MRRHLAQGVLVIAVFVIVAWACSCANSTDTSAVSTRSPHTSAGSPLLVDLTLPTTIHAGTGKTGGAMLSEPSSRAEVTASWALGINHLKPRARRTGTVLADVTMPNDFYHGRRIRDLTCWVVVFTLPQAVDPRLGGPAQVNTLNSPAPPAPQATRRPMLVWHMVFIFNASDGDFVRGFFTKYGACTCWAGSYPTSRSNRHAAARVQFICMALGCRNEAGCWS